MWSELWSDMWSKCFLTAVREVELSLKARLYATFRRSWKAVGATGYTLPNQARYQLRYTPMDDIFDVVTTVFIL